MKYIKMLKMPNQNLISISAIYAVKSYEKGIGILDSRNRMIEWIDIPVDDEDSVRTGKYHTVLGIFESLINDSRHAQQPSWDFLDTEVIQPKKKASAQPAV
jgi:hypothetical protein